MGIRRFPINGTSTTHEQASFFWPVVVFSFNIPLTFSSPTIIRHLGGELAEW